MSEAKNELDALIVRNLDDLTDAIRRLEGIQQEAGKTIDEIVCDWCKAHKWHLVNEALESDAGLELSANTWEQENREDENSQVLASVWVCIENEDIDWYDHRWLSNLCNVSQSAPLNLFWMPKFRIIIPGGGIKKSRWRDFVTRGADQWITPLRELGFSYSDQEGGFFLPFIIDKEKLAEAIKQNAIEDAFDPLHDALKKLEDAKPFFDQILKAAEKEFSPGN